MRPALMLTLALAAVLALAAAAYLVLSSQSQPWPRPAESAPTRWSIAILGDSDSHAFHDHLNLHPEQGQRGGAFHDVTWQWGEWLAKVRPDAVDLGEWGRWGTRWPIALVQDKLGLGGRSPPKEDHRFNFAISGAGCDALMHGNREAVRLVRLMDREPLRWTRGAVVIRIGVNSFGQPEFLDPLARNPQDPAVQGGIASCLREIGAAVTLIHAHHPQTRVVIVGIFDNTHWALVTDRWQDPQALTNIQQGLAVFDQGVQAMVAADPARLAFFDDQAWFRERWGGRDAAGKPAYRTLTVGGRYAVANSSGDHPRHNVVGDGHAGTVWNLLWAQSLIERLNTAFEAGIPPLSNAEVGHVLDRELAEAWAKP
jgi:hypothetical protein